MQLHRRDVVHAATALLDSYGIGDLTMRRLARELDVSPGALYWHFANKQQLLGAVADRILLTKTDLAPEEESLAVERGTDRANLPVHHARGGDHVGARGGLREGDPLVELERSVIGDGIEIDIYQDVANGD